MNSEQFYRVALRYIDGFRPMTLKKMLRFAGSASTLFNKPDSWRSKMNHNADKKNMPSISNAIRRDVDAELKLMDTHDIRLAFYTDTDYPYRLKGCSDGPISFFYKGDTDFNSCHFLSIVGTRQASTYGCDCVKQLLSELKDSNIKTISGLAYGIDTAAHQYSLENHLITIAVLGNGFRTIYPQLNEPLAQQILEQGGALITEYDFYAAPERSHFPERNRIIAGMADAVIVAETGLSGGSIITARIAHSYNRDVFAFPGSIFSPLQTGCHELIRTNLAALLTSGHALLDMMNWEQGRESLQTSLFEDFTDTEQIVIDLIKSKQEIVLDQLAEELSQFSPSKLAGILLGLELKDAIICKPGKIYTLRYWA